MSNSLDYDALRGQSPFYNDDHEAWRAQLRRFIDQEIMPHAHHWDEAEAFPRDLYKKASEIGLLKLGFPEEFGGVDVEGDPFFTLVTADELARVGAGGINASLMVHSIGLPPVLALGSSEMKARVAPAVLSGEKIICLAITEPSGGSDVANIQTKAVLDGEDYVINGSKMFITGGLRADYYTVAVRTGGTGPAGVSLILIEKGRDGFSQAPIKKMGWWASDTAALYFDDVRVPKINLIGAEGMGFPGIMANFNHERLAMAAGAIGSARACLEDAISWARERKTFGKRLADHQVIRHKIADMLGRCQASQAMLEQCAWLVKQGAAPIAQLALLKVQATQTMEYCAREAAQILGGASFMRGCRVERIYREVRVNAIGGGSEEIMRDLAVRQLGL